MDGVVVTINQLCFTKYIGANMDISLINGTITSLRLAGDIAKGILQLNTLSEVQGKVIELQSAILAAQSGALESNAAQSAVVDEIRALKEEIARIKAWESQKQRYQLTSFGEGPAVMYALKKSMSESEPPHWICTKCYEDGKRMILQPRKDKNGFIVIACPSCNSVIHTRLRGIGPAEYV